MIYVVEGDIYVSRVSMMLSCACHIIPHFVESIVVCTSYCTRCCISVFFFPSASLHQYNDALNAIHAHIFERFMWVCIEERLNEYQLYTSILVSQYLLTINLI